jgi:hypothetical protein
LAIQAEDGTFFRKPVCLHVALDRGHCVTQFCSVLSIPGVTKTGEPLMRMGAAQTVVRVRTTSPRLRPV